MTFFHVGIHFYEAISSLVIYQLFDLLLFVLYRILYLQSL